MKIDGIENKKYEKDNPDRDQPLAPAMLHGPPERHALEKSQKQRRPTGKSAPPMLLTIKMKNAMCIGATRLLFIVIQGRMRSIDAPIVPIRFANTGPTKRKSVFLAGLLGALTRR